MKPLQIFLIFFAQPLRHCGKKMRYCGKNKRNKNKMKEYTTIKLKTGNGIATIQLNRPDIRNAFNEVMIAELTDAFREARVKGNPFVPGPI
jgi:1,4-dihydroxy-2-naphthoyl-CoA synthase